MIRKILNLATPVILGQITSLVLQFVDRLFIAKLGIDEAAGSSLSGSFIWLIISLTAIVTGGTIAFVSRRVGEKDFVRARKGAEQSIFLSLILGFIISILSFIFSEEIVNFYGATENVTRIGIIYFKTLIGGFTFLFSGMALASIFQSSGDTKTPMYIFMGMSILNLVLDPIFIFGFGFIPKMGIFGAALATVISEITAFIVGVVYLLKFKILSPRFINFFIPETTIIKRILSIGKWSGLSSFSRPLSAIMLQRIITYHGTKAVAAFSFGVQWISIYFVVMDGLKVAISTMVGQKLGELNYEEVYNIVRSGIKFGAYIVVVVTIIGVPLSDYAIMIFSNDIEIITMGANYLKIVILSLFFEVPMTIYTAAFNGAGDTKPPMIISFISNWIGKIPYAYIASYILGFGINSVWVAISLSIVMEGIGMWVWFKRGNWKLKTV